jgi:methionine-rich copper-binding protein CopC
MNRRHGIGLMIVLALSLVLLSTALAHAKLVSSDPTAGAKLAKAPAKVTLVFSEEISDKETESNFTVTDETGATVGTGKLDTNDLDHKTMSGALKAGLGDGIYTVKWNAVTPDDNGQSDGTFTFGVNKDPGAQPTARPEPTEAAELTPTAPSAGGATQPTAAPATKPTAAPAGGAAPTNLPRTGDGAPYGFGYALLGAIVLLASGMALRQVIIRARR